jgi:hypothetical protein
MAISRLGALTFALATAMAGCAHTRYVPGTNIPATEENIAVLQTVELYRERLVAKNIEGLLLLASPSYFEDGGTPQANDDYGFDGLRQILTTRLGRVQSLHYEIEYQKLAVRGDRAEIDVFLNGAFELTGETGERYRRVNDRHRFTLERIDNKWRFVNGM